MGVEANTHDHRDEGALVYPSKSSIDSVWQGCREAGNRFGVEIGWKILSMCLSNSYSILQSGIPVGQLSCFPPRPNPLTTEPRKQKGSRLAGIFETI